MLKNSKKEVKNVPYDFERQFKEHFAYLSLTSYVIVKNKEVAKDLVQDFYVSFWQKKDCIQIKTTFKTYAAKAIQNLSLAYLEKIKKDKLLFQELSYEGLETPEISEKSPTVATQLQNLLNQLPESRRAIFVASVVDNLSYKEIAESNNITVNTVKTQMKRAYAFLRNSLDKNDLIFILFLFA